MSRRDGVALVASVLLLLALTALAHGVLTLARFERVASRAGVDEFAVRLATDAALAALPDTLALLAEGEVPLGDARDSVAGTLGPASWTGRRRRVSRELWLEEGVARLGNVGTQTSARLVWVLDPVARVGAHAAALTVGGGGAFRIDGVVEGGALLRTPVPAPSEGCDAAAAALDSLFGGRAVPDVVSRPDSLVSRLGWLGLDTLLARIPIRVEGSGEPAPAERLGVCLGEEPWNWGDPLRPARACGGHGVVRATTADLAVNGGSGRVLLVVAGDLRVTDSELFGVLLVGGTLTLGGSARVTGLVRARSGAHVGPEARVDASACWAYHALARAGLRRPLAVPASGRIGPL